MPRQEAEDRLVERIRLLEVPGMGGVLRSDQFRAGNVLVNRAGHLDGGGRIVRLDDDHRCDRDVARRILVPEVAQGSLARRDVGAHALITSAQPGRQA